MKGVKSENPEPERHEHEACHEWFGETGQGIDQVIRQYPKGDVSEGVVVTTKTLTNEVPENGGEQHFKEAEKPGLRITGASNFSPESLSDEIEGADGDVVLSVFCEWGE